MAKKEDKWLDRTWEKAKWPGGYKVAGYTEDGRLIVKLRDDGLDRLFILQPVG